MRINIFKFCLFLITAVISYELIASDSIISSETTVSQRNSKSEVIDVKDSGIEAQFHRFFSAKDYQQAYETIQDPLSNEPKNAQLHYLAAQAAMGLKKYTLSVEHAAQAVINDPSVSDYYRLLADTEVLKQLGAEKTSILRLPGLAKRTRRNYISAINLNPSNIKAREGLGLFYLLAPGIVGGSVNKAKIQADEIAKLDKEKAYPFYIGIQKKSKNWNAAMNLAKDWENESPNLWKPQEEKFRIYFEQKQYEPAAEVLLNWLAKYPNENNANYLLGLLSSESGLYLEQGREALTKYLANEPELTQPGHEWSYYRLAIIENQLGDTENAKLSAQSALKESPENTKIADLVDKLLAKLN